MYDVKNTTQFTFDMLLDKISNVDLPDLKDVLRKATCVNGKQVLIPANGAIAVLLRMGSLDSTPTFEEIKANVSKWSKEKENGTEEKQK